MALGANGVDVVDKTYAESMGHRVFFSRRRRHTRYGRDWSSDVCSSDLLVDYDLAWRDDARRFEQITLPYQEFAGMNASLELLHELGPAAVASHVEGLVDVMVAWAADRDDVELVTPAAPERRAGIIALRPREPQAA